MYQKIEKWIDKVLQQDFPDDVVAVMFNLYEDGDALYSMERLSAQRASTKRTKTGLATSLQTSRPAKIRLY